MNSTFNAAFFRPGGTLPLNAPSYIRRQADEDAYACLLRGEFCYLLSSRQIGKSSLMIHVAARLRESGMQAVVLDLNAVGHQGLTAEQWYFSLLMQLGERLELEEALEQWWLTCPLPSPLQKWFAVIRQILKRHSQSLVIFMDEIDQVRALPFSTDDFFAAIRGCYNHRSEDPELSRLNFCLIGTALPSELIRDPRLTPFNVGRRIELRDFTHQEVSLLKAGLGREGAVAVALLERVYYWTAGHPYLTQRLCQQIVAKPEIVSATQVDALCRHLFFSTEARMQDDNLNFVQYRLLQGSEDRAGLLTFYRTIYRSQRVPEMRSGALADTLRLTGIIRSEQGRLMVRNRIYRRVFNLRWITEHMPAAELRRQQTAFRRGQLRAALIGMAGCITMACLAYNARHFAGIAHQKTCLAQQAALLARRNAVEAAGQRDEAQRLLYIANMNLLQRASEDHNVARVEELLEETRDFPERGFEWGYWNRLCHQNTLQLAKQNSEITDLQFLPDSKTIVSHTMGNMGFDCNLKLWNALTGAEGPPLPTLSFQVVAAALSPDGRRMVVSAAPQGGRIPDGFVGRYYLIARSKVLDAGTGKELLTLEGNTGNAMVAAYSPDGRRIAMAIQAASILFDASHKMVPGRIPPGYIKVWDALTGKQLRVLNVPSWAPESLKFSPDGRRIATAQGGFALTEIWDLQMGKKTATLRTQAMPISMAWSPDGARLVTNLGENRAAVWDARTGRQLLTLTGHRDAVRCVAFSPDGRQIVTGSADRTIKIWNAQTGSEILALPGHHEAVKAIAFSPDGRQIVSGSSDGAIKVWHWKERRDTLIFKPKVADPGDYSSTLSYVRDGRCIAMVCDSTGDSLWNVETGKRLALLAKNAPGVGITDAARRRRDLTIALSPDGKRAITAFMKLSGEDMLRIMAQRQREDLLRFKAHRQRSVASQPESPPQQGIATLWDTETGRPLRNLNESVSPMDHFAFSSDGSRIINASSNAIPKLWDVQTGAALQSYRGDHGSVSDLAFSPDDKRIVIGNGDNTAAIWETQTGAEIVTLKGHTESVTCVAFSPDGRQVVTGSADHTAKVWDAQSGRELATLKGHTARVECVAFSPDGRRIATSSDDQLVKLWDAPTGRELLTLKDNKHQMRSLAFSPDGKQMAIDSTDENYRPYVRIYLSE